MACREVFEPVTRVVGAVFHSPLPPPRPSAAGQSGRPRGSKRPLLKPQSPRRLKGAERRRFGRTCTPALSVGSICPARQLCRTALPGAAGALFFADLVINFHVGFIATYNMHKVRVV